MAMRRLLTLLCAGLVCACGGASSDGNISSVLSGLGPSAHPGMGATLIPGGVGFRVWAPNARRVWVTGEFNGWGRHELGNEFNGNFSGDVPGAGKHQRYLYILENPWGGEQWRADPRARRMTNSNGESVVHDPNSYGWQSGNFQTPPFDQQVLYELHVGTFHDDPGFGPGNWHSAVGKLDYLRDLGVNMLYVMPVGEFPGDFSWGYNPSAPFAPESSYGTPDDMKFFVDQAHLRGMGVVFDVVHNHWGPNDMAMWCFSGDCYGHGGEYFYEESKSSTPWGKTRPDYRRPEVRSYIRDNVMMYLEEYRADGLRWDATRYIRNVDGSESTSLSEGWDLLRSINREIDEKFPWKRSIAEDFGAGNSITQPATSGGAGFDSQWSGDFVHPMRRVLSAQSDDQRSMNDVRHALTQNFNGRALDRVIYTENHDEVANGRQRVPEEIWPGNSGSWASRKRSTLGAAVLFTTPGTPMIFQGQEFVEDGFFQDTVPLDWSRAGAFAGITQMYRDLIKLRRNFGNNTRGLLGNNLAVHHLNDQTKIVAYHRWKDGGPGDDVIVVANFSERSYSDYRVGFPRGGTWRVRINTDGNGYAPDFGDTRTVDLDANGGEQDGMGQSGAFAIGPYSVVVFSQ